jgi:hypothetical protein
MRIEEAQHEVRTVFMWGFPGQLASGLIWLASAALATWESPKYGIVALVVLGTFVYPLTQLVLRAMGRPASLSTKNPLGRLAMQIAFTIPLNLPVVAGATLYRLNWFFPACMIVVGTHYLPFVFLYGMWQFAFLGAALIAGGTLIGLYAAGSFSVAGWVTASALLAFAAVSWGLASRDESRGRPAA